jgi:hypothetical protein
VIGVAGVVVLAAVGYVAYGRLKAKSAADEPARRVSRKNSEAPPTPASKSEPASPTANATPSTPVPDQSTPKPSEASPPAPPPPTPVAAAAKPAAPAVVPPSAAFVAWVKNLKITGMRSGASPRILVERATFSVGEVMNADLGITFDGYDASRRVLRFKDQTGAIVERSH